MWLLKGEPYEVQTKAIEKAEGRRGYAWFMEMGLGKTATAYAEFINLMEADLVDVMVIICPQSLKAVWANEAKEWGVQFDVSIWPKPGTSPSCHPSHELRSYNWQRGPVPRRTTRCSSGIPSAGREHPR